MSNSKDIGKYSISIENIDTGEIKEVLSIGYAMKYQERQTYRRIIDELYKLQHKLKGTFVGKREFAFVASDFLYYISIEQVPSRVNEITYTEEDFQVWKRWYSKSKILQQFDFLQIGLFSRISSKTLNNKNTIWHQKMNCQPTPLSFQTTWLSISWLKELN